jgi:3',5'-cyclic AMP phosphodiesterase CpdA
MPDPLPISDVNPKQDGLVTLLHLSDLHFRATTRATTTDKASYLTHLETCLGRCKDEGLKVDVVVVTGDLVDSENINQALHLRVLQSARGYLEHLCGQIGVSPTQGLLVIPGNHDYRWKGNVFVTRLRDNFQKTFDEFNRHVLFPHLKLLVACFDSNAGTYRFELAKGKVDLTAFDRLRQQVDQTPEPFARLARQEAVRVALVHHHPLPIAEAETLEPRSWVDWMFGRMVEGASEYMLLRNSGSFLHRLLQENFRLVLHGHLHRRGYWLPGTTFGEDHRWLEVIACGSCGQPADGKTHTFNVVKIHTSGLVDSEHFHFTGEGQFQESVKLATAGYDVVRGRAWERRPRQAGKLCCKTWSLRWDVILPEGDVVTTNVFRGLRSDTGAAVKEMPLFASSPTMTVTHFDCRSLTHGIRVTPQRVPDNSVTPPRFNYKLVFEPPLANDQEADVLCEFKAFGVLHTSSEAQQYAQVDKKYIGEEGIGLLVDRACERLLINLRFVARPEWVPAELSLAVRNTSDEPIDQERHSGHVNWDYWGPDRSNRLATDLPALAQASVSVYRPQMGHTYELNWKLRAQEPILNRPELLHLQGRLANIDQSAKHFKTAQKFCHDVLACVWEGLEAEAPGVRNDPQMVVNLYAFDGAALLIRKASYGQTNVLPEQIAWGQNVVGEAFRRRVPWGFSRLNLRSGADSLYNLPPAVQVVVAFPLPVAPHARRATSPQAGATPQPASGATTADWPAGVVALVSTSQGSALHSLAEHGERGLSLWENIRRLWDTWRNTL